AVGNPRGEPHATACGLARFDLQLQRHDRHSSLYPAGSNSDSAMACGLALGQCQHCDCEWVEAVIRPTSPTMTRIWTRHGLVPHHHAHNLTKLLLDMHCSPSQKVSHENC